MRIVTGPAIYVCRYCGPLSLGYAGRIVLVTCEKCRSLDAAKDEDVEADDGTRKKSKA